MVPALRFEQRLRGIHARVLPDYTIPALYQYNIIYNQFFCRVNQFLPKK